MVDVLKGHGYEEVRVIGRGSFGCALLAKRLSDGALVVAKQINVSAMTEKEREDALTEVRVLKELTNHPNIICYHESFVEVGILNIIMDYADGGDLSEVITHANGKLFAEEQILDWCMQIALGLKHVHEKNILHRDLKTQNIFLTKRNNVLKLGDFGIAKVLQSETEMAKTVIGTPYYLSPELCEDKAYNQKSDVWAFGCVLYELTTLKRAFDGQNLPAVILKILRGTPPPIPTIYSAELRGLISSMLKIDPDSRPTLKQIVALPCLRLRMANFLRAQQPPTSKPIRRIMEHRPPPPPAQERNTDIAPQPPPAALPPRPRKETGDRPSDPTTSSGAEAAAPSSSKRLGRDDGSEPSTPATPGSGQARPRKEGDWKERLLDQQQEINAKLMAARRSSLRRSSSGSPSTPGTPLTPSTTTTTTTNTTNTNTTSTTNTTATATAANPALAPKQVSVPLPLRRSVSARASTPPSTSSARSTTPSSPLPPSVRASSPSALSLAPRTHTATATATVTAETTGATTSAPTAASASARPSSTATVSRTSTAAGDSSSSAASSARTASVSSTPRAPSVEASRASADAVSEPLTSYSTFTRHLNLGTFRAGDGIADAHQDTRILEAGAAGRRSSLGGQCDDDFGNPESFDGAIVGRPQKPILRRQSIDNKSDGVDAMARRMEWKQARLQAQNLKEQQRLAREEAFRQERNAKLQQRARQQEEIRQRMKSHQRELRAAKPRIDKESRPFQRMAESPSALFFQVDTSESDSTSQQDIVSAPSSTKRTPKKAEAVQAEPSQQQPLPLKEIKAARRRAKGQKKEIEFELVLRDDMKFLLDADDTTPPKLASAVGEALVYEPSEDTDDVDHGDLYDRLHSVWEKRSRHDIDLETMCAQLQSLLDAEEGTPSSVTPTTATSGEALGGKDAAGGGASEDNGADSSFEDQKKASNERNERLSVRIEHLRLECGKALGEDRFCTVYKYMREAKGEDDDGTVQNTLKALLGPQNEHLVRVVNQLLYCEDLFYG